MWLYDMSHSVDKILLNKWQQRKLASKQYIHLLNPEEANTFNYCNCLIKEKSAGA